MGWPKKCSAWGKTKKQRGIVEYSTINLGFNTCWTMPEVGWLHAPQMKQLSETVVLQQNISLGYSAKFTYQEFLSLYSTFLSFQGKMATLLFLWTWHFWLSMKYHYYYLSFDDFAQLFCFGIECTVSPMHLCSWKYNLFEEFWHLLIFLKALLFFWAQLYIQQC